MKIDEEFQERDLEFRFELEFAESVFMRKNREYNDGISATGVLGAVIELFGAAQRLIPLVIHNRKFDDDIENEKFLSSLRNALVDMVVYGAIALLMMRKGNWRGE